MRLRRFVICALSDCKLHFHIINDKIFEKKNVNVNKMFVLIVSKTLSEIFLIFRITESHMIKMYIGLHVKYQLFLSDFNER